MEGGGNGARGNERMTYDDGTIMLFSVEEAVQYEG